jgi:transposase
MTLLTEQKLSLNKLAQREGVNISTVWRWVQRGVRGVKLDSYSAGARRYSTEQAWVRFCEATTAVAQGESRPPLETRTNRSRQASIDRAERELDNAGA